MSQMTREEFDAFWERVAAKQAASIGVDITGWNHFEKQSTGEDTFQWVAGPEIEAFYKRHDLTVMSSNSSDRRNITTFFFPTEREDLAVLFKLTFGGQ